MDRINGLKMEYKHNLCSYMLYIHVFIYICTCFSKSLCQFPFFQAKYKEMRSGTWTFSHHCIQKWSTCKNDLSLKNISKMKKSKGVFKIGMCIVWNKETKQNKKPIWGSIMFLFYIKNTFIFYRNYIELTRNGVNEN